MMLSPELPKAWITGGSLLSARHNINATPCLFFAAAVAMARYRERSRYSSERLGQALAGSAALAACSIFARWFSQ